jgi:hypothetical protein
MMTHPWTRSFPLSEDDVDSLVNLLLERETPMTTEQLALILMEQRLQSERDALEARYRDTQLYNPAQTYADGARLIFPQFEYATATVKDVRDGDNAQYGPYQVIAVEFDTPLYNAKGDHYREFAAGLSVPHALVQAAEAIDAAETPNMSAPEILEQGRNVILGTLQTALKARTELMQMAGQWFVRDLVMDVDAGMLHLAEAVLDMNNGGPLTPEEIIEQIGGLGEGAIGLQVFSLNLALSKDNRFDEVGPSGQIWWYLVRMEPAPVRTMPEWLEYKEIPYDEDLLSDDMIDLETELDDELTDIDFEGRLRRATTTLLYPHRRAGTLPLNAKTRMIFPSARTPRIYVELVDMSDGEKFTGWVVHEHQYVYGLEPFYAKHHFPIGGRLTVERGEGPGQINLSFEGYKARTEWIRMFVPSADHIAFENRKRAIGAAYDELFIFGVDDLPAVDQMVKAHRNKTMVTILRTIMTELGKLSPQGTVHVTTLYSVFNVIRRSPPGPLFAILRANSEFEDVGDHYWKLSQERG